MMRQARPKAISDCVPDIPGISDLPKAVLEGTMIMPKILSMMPAEDGDKLLNCLFFKDKLVLLLGSGAWSYYLRLREAQIRAILPQNTSKAIKIVYRSLPDDDTAHGDPVKAAVRPMVLPEKRSITNMQKAATGMRHDGLRDALLALSETLGSLGSAK